MAIQSSLNIDSPVNWTSEAIFCNGEFGNDVPVVQLTSQPILSTNIYPEQRFASADGSRIAIHRMPFGQPDEIWIVDLKSLQMCRIAQGTPVAANAHLNAVYYLDDSNTLSKVDLVELTTTVVHKFDVGHVPRVVAVAPDETCLIGGPFHRKDNCYVLHRIDLATGQTSVLLETADISNPHLQFDPADPNRVLLQINRTGHLRTETSDQTAGPPGATLAIINSETGEMTPLPVGKPHTRMISGHETWIGQTGRILFTTAPTSHPELAATSGVFTVACDDSQSKSINLGKPFNHVAVSDDGNYFIVDDHQTRQIWVGSTTSGRVAMLCESHTRQGKPQYTHAHPYMTPDNRYVIFTSNMTGVSQVYAARVPDQFLIQVDSQDE